MPDPGLRYKYYLFDMTYPQAIQFLYDLRLFGTKFGLENTLKLAALAGNPQEKLRFIHVAGTNGKGSTCAMLESIYRASGLRVGLFTSPHLVSFAERIQVDRQLISETGVTRLVAEMQGLLKNFPHEVHPTFFEVVTVMALRYFAEQQCDLVILETGMGGRLDSTNIVTPLASVITNVQFDHQQWLGDTIAKIAHEKAGIIKPGISVITGAEDPDALAVIDSTARALKAPLTRMTRADIRELQDLPMPLMGEHQQLNAAVALATVSVLQTQLSVSQAAIKQGLREVEWAGRLQLLREIDVIRHLDAAAPSQATHAESPSKSTILLDGAHNPAGAQTLALALQTYFASAKPTLILGAMRDKDWPAMCNILAPQASRILLCPTGSDRTADPQLLVRYCQQANPTASITVCETLVHALRLAAGEPFITLAGSLYIIGEAMELLHLSPAAAQRGLNEWSAVPKA